MQDTAILIHIADILKAHGVKGLVKVRVYVDDLSLFDEPVMTDHGPLRVHIKNSDGQGVYLAAIDGVTDRTIAETYSRRRLFVPREALPEPPPGEHYRADLVGTLAVTQGGNVLGTVLSIQNYGASDVLDIRSTDGRHFMIPFAPPFLVGVQDNRIEFSDDTLSFLDL